MHSNQYFSRKRVLVFASVIVLAFSCFLTGLNFQVSKADPYTVGVSIAPESIKLSPLQPHLFQAYPKNGTAPYTFEWSEKIFYTQDNNTQFFKVGNSEAILNFVFNETCEYAILQVKVTDAWGNVGYAFTTVYDPAALTIASGIYPGAPSYTIWAEGGTYYAKNAYGVISWSSTNATAIWDSALSAIGSYGTLKLVGSIHTSNTLFFNATAHGAVSVDIETLYIDANVNGIYIYSTAGSVWTGKLTCERIYYAGGYGGAIMTLRNIYYGSIDVGIIYPSVTAGVAGSIGIQLLADGSTVYSNHVKFGTINSCYYGVYLQSQPYGILFNNIEGERIEAAYAGIYLRAVGATSYISTNTFKDISITDLGDTIGKYGVLLYPDAAASGIGGNDFYSISVNDLTDAGDVAFELEGGTYGTDNYYFGCRTIDLSFDANVKDIWAMSGKHHFIGGQFTHAGIYNTITKETVANLTMVNVEGFPTVSHGVSWINSATSTTFDHNLWPLTPTHVNIAFQDLGAGDWKWNASSTQITITVANSGTYDFSWEAITDMGQYTYP